MRINTWMSGNALWFLHVIYEETGNKNFIRIGTDHAFFGGDKEKIGMRRIATIEVRKQDGAVELFPGAVIFALVQALTPKIDMQYLASLSERDKVEFIRPTDIVIVDENSLRQVIGHQPSFMQKQLDGRKKIVG